MRLEDGEADLAKGTMPTLYVFRHIGAIGTQGKKTRLVTLQPRG